MKKYLILGFVLITMTILALTYKPHSQQTNILDTPTVSEKAFTNIGLQTNTSIADIPLNEILGGGPIKDGIPALSNPKFVNTIQAKNIPNESLGVLIVVDLDIKFYPYTILVHHEIINDIIDEVPVAVTFCPLCGSAIVYKRSNENTIHEFGVSGKLWQSNLLMYDKETESLWSQIEGRAVVGDLTGATLNIYPSQVVTWEQAKNAYPEGLEVLSEETGYNRNYGFYPYGDYEDGDDLIFPINNPDNSLPAKTLMYASIINGEVVAFHRENVLKQKTANIETASGIITATVTDNSEIILTDEKGVTYPGYVTMWFSWANHNNGIVWRG